MSVEEAEDLASLTIELRRPPLAIPDLPLDRGDFLLKTHATVLDDRLVKDLNLVESPFGHVWELDPHGFIEADEVLVLWGALLP